MFCDCITCRDAGILFSAEQREQTTKAVSSIFTRLNHKKKYWNVLKDSIAVCVQKGFVGSPAAGTPDRRELAGGGCYSNSGRDVIYGLCSSDGVSQEEVGGGVDGWAWANLSWDKRLCCITLQLSSTSLTPLPLNHGTPGTIST